MRIGYILRGFLEMGYSIAASTDAIQAVCLLSLAAGVLSPAKIALVNDARKDIELSLKYFERDGKTRLSTRKAAASLKGWQKRLDQLAAQVENGEAVSSLREDQLVANLVDSIKNQFLRRLCLAWAQTITRTAGCFEMNEFQYIAGVAGQWNIKPEEVSAIEAQLDKALEGETPFQIQLRQADRHALKKIVDDFELGLIPEREAVDALTALVGPIVESEFADDQPPIGQIGIVGDDLEYKLAWLLDRDNRDYEDHYQTTLTMAVISEELCKAQFLIERGADINQDDYDEKTTLAHAISCRDPDLVQFCLDHGASLTNVGCPSDDIYTIKSISAASVCADCGGVDMLRMILDAGGDVDEPVQNNRPPLEYAAHRGDIESVKLLIERGANPDHPPHPVPNFGKGKISNALLVATEAKHDAIAIFLIECGANVNVADGNGTTPLQQAAYNGSIETVQALLAKGASASLGDHNGRAPLHIACTMRRADVVELLLEAGADPNAAIDDIQEGTPLIAAARQGYLKPVSLLLEAGADPLAKSKRGATAAKVAAYTLRKGRDRYIDSFVAELKATAALLSSAEKTAISNNLPPT